MPSAVISGMVSNIQYALDDESGVFYPSGKVLLAISRSVPTYNGYMGTCFQWVAESGISPEISGTMDQGLMELYVECELVRSKATSAARVYNITSFKEGDSSVTMSDAAKSLTELYKVLKDQWDDAYKKAKYSRVSSAPSTVLGTDAQMPEYLPYNQTDYYKG